MTKHIVIIGGGLAGTTAAHELVKRGYAVTIIEKNDRLGGRIYSRLIQGTAVEMGAGFLTKTYTNLMSFLDESRLSERLSRQHSPSGIYKDGKVIMVSPRTLLGREALSWRAKMHALPLAAQTLSAWPNLDRHAFYKAGRYDDKAVAAMFTGNGGEEFLEYVLQPMLNGYFYWTPEHTSRAMLLILCKEALSHGTYRLRGGLQRIPEKLAEGCTVLLGHEVQHVARTGSTYTVEVSAVSSSRTITADGIVCATTASAVLRIFMELSQEQQDFFTAIGYSSGALVAQTYPAQNTKSDRSIAFPRKEGIPLSAVTLYHETGDKGMDLASIKTYASGASAAQIARLSDKDLTRTLTANMEPIKDSMLKEDQATPQATNIQRWPEALPIFDTGHFKRLRQFEDGGIENQTEAVVFAGDYIGGPFMEGAFTSGLRAAERLDKRLRH